MRKILVTILLLNVLLLPSCSNQTSPAAVTILEYIATPASSTLTASPTIISTPTRTPTSTLLPELTSTNQSWVISTSTPQPAHLTQPITEANATKLKEIAKFGAPKIYSAAFSLDGQRILAATSDGYKVYDRDYDLVTTLEGIYPAKLYGNYPTPKMDAAGDRFVTVTENQVSAYDLEQGLIFSSTLNTDLPYGMAWASISPNGKWIAVPEMPGEEMLYVGRWQVIDVAFKIVLHEGHGTNGAFSPDGKIFAAEVENQLTFWNTDTWEKITSFGLGASRNWSFSPNGNVAVATGNELNIWSIEPRQIIRQISFSYKRVSDMNFTQDGQNIVITGYFGDRMGMYEKRAWKISNGQEVKDVPAYNDTFAAMQKIRSLLAPGGYQFPQDGNQVIFSVGENDILFGSRVYDLSAKGYKTNACSFNQNSCLSLNGALGITSNKKGFFTAWPAGDGSVKVVSGLSEKGSTLATIIPGNQDLTLLGVSPDNSYLIYSTSLASSSTLFIKNLNTGRTYSEFVGGLLIGGKLETIFSVNGRRLAIVPVFSGFQSECSPLIIFDLLDGISVIYRRPFDIHEWVFGGAFSADGELFAYELQKDGPRRWHGIKIIDPFHNTPIIEFEGSLGAPAAFFPGGSILATINAGDINIVDATTGALITSWEAHADTIIRLAFSLDGRHLLTYSLDGFVKVWGIPGI